MSIAITTERTLNVVLAPGSDAHRATHPAKPRPSGGPRSASLAAGFEPLPEWNLLRPQGRTIGDLVFVNVYVGKRGAWAPDDVGRIDDALIAAMTDERLQGVIAQYYDGPPSSRMLQSVQHEAELPATVYKDTAEELAASLYVGGVLAGENPADCVINIMLPKGIYLSDDFSPGFHPPAGGEQQHERRRRGTIRLPDDDAASSRRGLGGYHGSVRPDAGSKVCYAIGVRSEGHNGIAAFDEPWKSVVATFYHELNEARTDPDVEEVNATGDGGLLGWYSQVGRGEIGDLPINACGGDLALVFQEVPLAGGGGKVPIQLMWSNDADGPALRT